MTIEIKNFSEFINEGHRGNEFVNEISHDYLEITAGKSTKKIDLGEIDSLSKLRGVAERILKFANDAEQGSKVSRTVDGDADTGPDLELYSSVNDKIIFFNISKVNTREQLIKTAEKFVKELDEIEIPDDWDGTAFMLTID